MKLKRDARQHHFCPFTDNIPYIYEQESHHKVSLTQDPVLHFARSYP